MSLPHFLASLSSARLSAVVVCLGVSVVSTAMVGAAESVSADSKNSDVIWPQWRGGSQQGVAPEGDYPVEWSEEKATRCKIPGSGASTPVIVGNRAFLTSGIDGQNHLLGVDIDSLKIAFQTPLGDDRGNKHRKGSGSNPSAVTDGKTSWRTFVVVIWLVVIWTENRSGTPICKNSLVRTRFGGIWDPHR